MSELKSHIKINSGSDRGFGIVFATVLFVIGLYPLLSEGGLQLWAIIAGSITLVLAFVFPKIFFLPNKLWFKLGLTLGAIVAPVVIALVYFVTVVPTGLIMKLAGKDMLNKKIDKNAKSYWIKRSQPVNSMKDQF